jgi:hypothetical protein
VTECSCSSSHSIFWHGKKEPERRERNRKTTVAEDDPGPQILSRLVALAGVEAASSTSMLGITVQRRISGETPHHGLLCKAGRATPPSHAFNVNKAEENGREKRKLAASSAKGYRRSTCLSTQQGENAVSRIRLRATTLVV